MARRQAIEAAIARLDAARVGARSPRRDRAAAARASSRAAASSRAQRSDGDAGHKKLTELHDEIELQLIEAERQHVNDLFRNGKLKDEARRRIERELDLREAQIANRRAEE